MVFVSVIIPVYNASLYLERCFDSLRRQTFMECEFIFVNDGSTDSSAALLERFISLDARVQVLHQDNRGVSEARNLGLSCAVGTYIGFVDADDHVATDYFERLFKVASSGLDIVVCQFSSTQEGTPIVSRSPFKTNVVLDRTFIAEQLVPFFIGNESLNSCCTKLYKRSLIVDNSIKFPSGVALGEDGLFNSYCFSKAQQVIFLDYVGYHYFEASYSATRAFNFEVYFKRIIEESRQDYSFLQSEHLTQEKITLLKAKKYVSKIISLMHQCASMEACLFTKNVRIIVNEPVTRKIVGAYFKAFYSTYSSYERLILVGIQYRLVFLIKGLIAYSTYRNKK